MPAATSWLVAPLFFAGLFAAIFLSAIDMLGVQLLLMFVYGSKIVTQLEGARALTSRGSSV